MKASYRQVARDDLIRQFRYYLITVERPDVAIRFRDAVRKSIAVLRDRPLVGARYLSGDQRLRNVRSWPVQGFEAIRIYYIFERDAIEIIRILHGSRDVKRILENQ